jgi:streptogramin lyase
VSIPSGLASDSSGNLYVSDHTNNTIVRFDPGGNESVFASTLSLPGSLAIDGSGNLYALAGGGLEKFDSGGNEITNVALNIGFIYNIACDSSGNVYMSDNIYGRIFKYDSSGTLSLFASGLGGPAGPTGLACDTNGNLYVSMFNSNTILKFTPNGNQSTFANTNLDGPYGLALDSSDNLFVANEANNTIEEFDSSGNGTLFASSYLDHPEDIAIDSIPEPSTLLLAALGALTLWPYLKRRRG